MPDLSKAPREAYTCEEVQLQFPAPYQAGHTLKENEAGALNQTFRENLRNNFSKKCKQMKKEGKSVEEIQKAFDEYAAGYEFGVRSGGGGRTADPVRQLAIQLAEKFVKEGLKKSGVSLRDTKASQIRAAANELLDDDPRGPKLLAIAEKQHKEQEKLFADVG